MFKKQDGCHNKTLNNGQKVHSVQSPLKLVICQWQTLKVWAQYPTECDHFLQEYAMAIKHILEMSDVGVQTLCDRARAYVDLFSEKEFEMKWLRATEALMR